MTTLRRQMEAAARARGLPDPRRLDDRELSLWLYEHPVEQDEGSIDLSGLAEVPPVKRKARGEMSDNDPWRGLGAALVSAGRSAGWYGYRYFYHTNDPAAVLSYAHYSDPHFDGDGAVIYGDDTVPAAEGAYDDRLYQWEPEKHRAAWDAAVAAHGDQRTARRLEAYLGHYYGRPVTLVSIRAGTRQDNGYSWHYYRWNWRDA